MNEVVCLSCFMSFILFIFYVIVVGFSFVFMFKLEPYLNCLLSSVYSTLVNCVVFKVLTK